MNEKPKVIWFEPVFFLFFGVFHMHRIWGLIDRNGYADFWLSIMNNRNWFYYMLTGVLSLLCVAGIVTFVRNKGQNHWWRWVYLFGGGYVLWDLFAILIGLGIWKDLLHWMLDVANPYWNILWGVFIGLGLLSFANGVFILKAFCGQRGRRP
ncbi:MAG: hypothetical protein FWF69_03530 [Firmicutes bacterium]|nr:hypothetical protein [Bacillota bacterium]